MTVRLLRHSESFEVRYSDGRDPVYFYFCAEPVRRALMGRFTEAEALEKAKERAREG